MKEGWKEYKLDELGKVGRGKSKHRPRNDASLYNGKYPFIQTGDIKGANLYISKYTQTYNEKGLAQSKLWKRGTLCITIAANISETAILDIEACFPDSVIGFISDVAKSDVKFVKYHFDLLKLHLQSISQGTTQDNLSQEKLLKFNFTVPIDVKHQKRIASILSAYDDLIEVNNQRIELLEQSARELYKEWFVRMRFPNYQNTKLNKGIPEGWEVKKLGEIVDITSSKRIFLSEYTNEGIPFYRGKEISMLSRGESINGILYISNKRYEDIKSKFGVPKEGDILITAVGTIGNTYSVVDNHKFYFKDGNLIWLRIENENLSSFLHLLLSSQFISDLLDSFSIGSSQSALTIDILKKVALLQPKEDILINFSRMSKPIYNQIETIQKQNQELTEIRNRLLPRLISGKLEVKA